MRFAAYIPVLLLLSGCTNPKEVYVMVTPTPSGVDSTQIPAAAPTVLPPITPAASTSNEELAYLKQFGDLNSKFGALCDTMQVEFDKRPVHTANFIQYQPSVAQLRRDFQSLPPNTPPALIKAKFDLDTAISELDSSLQIMQSGVQSDNVELTRSGVKKCLAAADLNIASMQVLIDYTKSKGY